MNQLTLLTAGIISLTVGTILGYYARQSIAKRDWKTIEAKIQKRIQKAVKDSEGILSRSKEKAFSILKKAKREEEDRRRRLFRGEQLISKREGILDRKISDFDVKQKEFQEKIEKLKEIKLALGKLKDKALKDLEGISGLSKREAREELFKKVEKEYGKDILERIREV